MVEGDFVGPKSNFAVIFKQTVFSVANQRHPPSGKLSPDLVCPTGDQFNADFGDAATLRKQFIVQNGFLYIFSRLRYHIGFLFCLIPQQKILQSPLGFFGNTMNNGKIFLLEYAFPDLTGRPGRTQRQYPDCTPAGQGGFRSDGIGQNQ